MHGKASGACAWESQRAAGNRDPLLKGTCKITHALRHSEEALIRKEPGSDTVADLGEPPREAEGNWDSPWDIDAGCSHLGSSFYHEGTGAGHCTGVFSLAC